MQSDSLLVLRNNAKKGTAISYIEAVRLQGHNQGTKFASLCRLNDRPHGIEIFSDLASLLEVFGSTSGNKITLIKTISLNFYFYTETGSVRHG